MAINYTDTTWVAGSSPGISATQLNRIDSGVEALYAEWQDDMIGALVMYAAAAAPTSKWLICDGAEVSRTTYAELFSLIGHTYATNPGGGNFTLPDFQGRLPIGKVVTSPTALNALGKTAGSWGHRHEQNAHQHAGGDHTHSIPATDSGGASHTHGNTSTGSSGGHGHALSGSVESSSHAITLSQSFTDSTSLGSTVQAAARSTSSQDRHSHPVRAEDASLVHAHSAGTLAVITATGHTHTTSVTGSTTDSHSHTTSANTGSRSVTTANDGGGDDTDAANPPVLVVNFLIRALP